MLKGRLAYTLIGFFYLDGDGKPNTNRNKKMKESNDLRYTVSKKAKNGDLVKINIRLNDECKNGHQDFAITADIYGPTSRGNRWIAGGCCHDEILEVKPEFAQFVRLHLCDYLGIPMHASANGFYHLRNGFNSEKVDDPKFDAKYCEYYRITPAQFASLNKCENELQFKIALESLGILDQWKVEADQAIATLEALTETKFVVDSVRSQYTPATETEIAAENERIESGYYSAKAKRQRETDKQKAIISEMRQKLESDYKDAKLTLKIKCDVLRIGGKKALDNCIFYTHTKTLAFNWKSYDQLSETEINRIISKLKLPAGVKTQIKDGRDSR